MYCPLVLFPAPGLGSRSILRGAAGVAALPPFHFFPSSPANAAAAAVTSSFPSASAQPTISPSASSDPSISPPSLQYPYADGSESGLSSSALPAQLYSFSPLSSPRSGFTSPSLSPGPNIRRLAEQFLNSLPDDSPAHHSRSIGKGQSSRAGPASTAPSPAARDAAAAQARDSAHAAESAATAEAEAEIGLAASGADMRVTELATDDASAWQQLHEELLAFARLCSADAAAQHKLRQDLVARTRWSIRAVWPQAEVDLVGSVAAGVALPKSDLDFVVWFDKSCAPPKAFAYTTGTGPASLPQLPYAVVEAAGAAGAEIAGAGAAAGAEREKDVTKSPGYSAVAAASPLSTTSTISLSSTSSTSSVSSPASSTTSLSSSHRVYQYFAHAGALIKLIGGRKKSKLLFRSTKIQVFKDINLIRLRDGCSGVSMDLWFPADAAHLCRSQRHTQLLQRVANEWPHFTVLAFVVKSFMQQQLLNSGYSGLGSYGVLLMIVRFLQMERQTSSSGHGGGGGGQQQPAADAADAEAGGKTAQQHQETEAEENVGRLLCRFFRFWAEFDYVTHGVDVRGDGSFIEKPVVVQDSTAKMRLVTTRRQQQQQQYEQRGAGDADEADDDADIAEGDDDDRQPASSCSSHAPRRVSRRVASATVRVGGGGLTVMADRLSLVICDPCDTSNYIVCHHKALRNLIQAYITACRVLDPLSPPPQPALEVQAMAALTDIEGGSLSSSASTASSVLPSVSSSAVGSTASTAPTTPITTAPSSAAPTPPLTASSSPTLGAADATVAVPAADGFSAAAAPSRMKKSRFHRLIDIHQARVGPKMKLCPSPLCVQPDGSSTLCPVQNKNCFACGHAFARVPDSSKFGYKTSDTSAQQQQQDGRAAAGGGGGAAVGRGGGRAGRSAQRAQQQQAQSLSSQSRLRTAAPAASRSGQPLNRMTANGLIANTNGMKFVSQPPLSSAQQPRQSPPQSAMSPAAAAGGFVYVNSPSPSGPVPSASAPHPTPFSLSMPVTPFYPPSPPAYYPPAFDPSFPPYTAPYAPLPPSASGKRAAQYRQQRSTSATGMVPAAAAMAGGMGGGMGGAMALPGSPSFAPMLPAYYPDPAQLQQPYLGPAAYYAAAPYYAAPGLMQGRYM